VALSIEQSDTDMSDKDIRRRKQEGIDMRKSNIIDDDDKNLKCKSETHFSRSDIESMALLSVLYTLQGIPMGLSASVPLLLANKVIFISSLLHRA
jgi:hypothetical protein